MSQHQACQEDHGHDEPLQTFEYVGPIVLPVKNCIEQCIISVTLSHVCRFWLGVQSCAWEQMILEKIALKSLGACQHEYSQALKTQKFGCTLENPESAIHVDVHSRRFTYQANLQDQWKSIQKTDSGWGIAQCRWFISLSVGLYLRWHPHRLCSRLAICLQRRRDSANRLTWDFLVARHAGHWHHPCRCSGFHFTLFLYSAFPHQLCSAHFNSTQFYQRLWILSISSQQFHWLQTEVCFPTSKSPIIGSISELYKLPAIHSRNIWNAYSSIEHCMIEHIGCEPKQQILCHSYYRHYVWTQEGCPLHFVLLYLSTPAQPSPAKQLRLVPPCWSLSHLSVQLLACNSGRFYSCSCTTSRQTH